MKILDYIQTNPNSNIGEMLILDANAEVLPVRGDCCLVIIKNSKAEQLKKYEGYSMLFVPTDYNYSNSPKTFKCLMISESKEKLINAYGYLMSKNLVNLSSRGSYPTEEIIKALKDFKNLKYKSNILSFNTSNLTCLDNQDFSVAEDEEEIPGIDDEYYSGM